MTKPIFSQDRSQATGSSRSGRKTRLLLPLFAALALVALPGQSSGQGLRLSPGLGGSPTAGAAAFRPAAQPALPDQQRAADFIVVVVNNEPITNNEVRSRVVRAEQQLSQQGAAMPPRDQITRQIIERLINEKLQLQAARESGLKIDDAAVDLAERNIAQQNQISVAEMRQRIRRDGVDPDQFREDIRNQMLLTRLREREGGPRSAISEREIDEFIKEQKGVTDLGSMELNIAHVLIEVPENATAEQVATLKAKADKVADRARAGEDFGKLVVEFSDAPGAKTNGGVIGLRTADRYPPLFVRAAASRRAGGSGGPIRSAAGFHVLKVLEKRQGKAAGTTVVQNRARHILLIPNSQLSESAAKDKLADYKRRIQTGQADFATLARENSQDGSAREGGELGWANPGQYVPEFEETLAKLKPGDISDPVVSRFGVHLIQLEERRDYTLTEREQRELVRNILREKKSEEAFILWAQELRARAYVEYRDQTK